jgi:hypothetical protein
MAFLLVCQYVPYKLLKTSQQDMFLLNFGQEAIRFRLANMATSNYYKLAECIEASLLVGGTELETKVNSSDLWFHIWKTYVLAFGVAATSREYNSMRVYFSQRFSKALFMSDCWEAQLQEPAESYQMCFSFRLCEITCFERALFGSWSVKRRYIVKKALVPKRNLHIFNCKHPISEVAELDEPLDIMLLVDVPGKHLNIKVFIKCLVEKMQRVLTILFLEDTLFENNASEIVFSKVKTRSKISGCFKNEKGTIVLAQLWSVIDTATKYTRDIFFSWRLFAKGY